MGWPRALGIALLATGAIAGCGSVDDDTEIEASAFRAHLDRQVERSLRTGAAFQLEPPNDMHWDRAYVIGPYATGQQIRESFSRRYGFRWNDPPDVESEFGRLLVFFAGDRIAGHVLLDTEDLPALCFDTTDADETPIPRDRLRLRAAHVEADAGRYLAIMPARDAWLGKDRPEIACDYM